MIDTNTIMTNIKAILDADVTMKTLLGVKSASKVILGVKVPDGAAPPLVNLADMTENVEDFSSGWTRFILGVVVRTENTDGNLANYEAFSDIGNRVHALLDSQTISGMRGMVYSGAMQVTSELEHDSVSIKQYRYLILGL